MYLTQFEFRMAWNQVDTSPSFLFNLASEYIIKNVQENEKVS
jgi:hypothetical protein